MVTPQMFVKLVSSGAQLQAQIVGSDDSSAWSLGDDGDVVFFLRSTALGANTALSGVLVETPVTPALAVDSAIISNTTTSGDILFAVADSGGNSRGLLHLDSSGPDINIPVDVGLTFGDSGQKIESDGTDFTIASGAKLNLTPTSDVHIANGTGLVIGHTAQLSIGNPGTAEFQMHGTANPDSSIILGRWSSNDDPPRFAFVKSKSLSQIGTYTTVANNDRLGAIEWYAADGTNANNIGARITATIDTTANSVATNRIPTELVFSTAKGASDYDLAVRMIIKPTGEIDLQSNALGLTNVGASGNDWTQNSLKIENANAGGDNYLRIANTSTTSGSRAILQLNVAAATNCDAYVGYEVAGAGNDWAIGVDQSNSYAMVISAGAAPGTNDALRITTATPPITTYNTTHPTGTFDYVCESCGTHQAELFNCCGVVEWHDDVMDFRAMALQDESAIDYMERVGVVERTTDKDGKPELFTKLGADFHFAMSAAFQNRQRMDAQNEAMDERLKRIEQALGV
jgi:hypothetical protein